MLKRAQPHPESDRHVLCPLCDTVCELPAEGPGQNISLCLGCGARITRGADGTATFDDSPKADRQTVAEAARQADTPSGRGLAGSARRRPVRLGKKS